MIERRKGTCKRIKLEKLSLSLSKGIHSCVSLLCGKTLPSLSLSLSLSLSVDSGVLEYVNVAAEKMPQTTASVVVMRHPTRIAITSESLQ